MDIKPFEIPVRDVFDGYENNEETGQVVAYGGKLNVRPAYQREFVYDDKKKVAVMNSILHQFPLNVMYWSENEDGTYEMLDGQQRTISICDWLDNGYSKLPGSYITKDEAKRYGWKSQKGNLSFVAPGKVIGGDRYYNDDDRLPMQAGRMWFEADIDYTSGYRGFGRILYSNDGLIFVTYDHYNTFVEVV